MSNLLIELIKTFVGVLRKKLTPDVVKEIIDATFDTIEGKIKRSKTQWDDRLILPILEGLRAGLNIPDDDEPTSPG